MLFHDPNEDLEEVSRDIAPVILVLQYPGVEILQKLRARWPATSESTRSLNSRQLVPDTFEHAQNHLLNHEMDLRTLDVRVRNDESGAPAYSPAGLLKVILFAYSRGIMGRRPIEQACSENVVFMALSGDSALPNN